MNETLITGGMQFQLWLSQIGVSPAEGYRWRKKGMISTDRVGKRLFVTQEAVDEFWRRTHAGEFAGKLHGCCAKTAKSSRSA